MKTGKVSRHPYYRYAFFEKDPFAIDLQRLVKENPHAGYIAVELTKGIHPLNNLYLINANKYQAAYDKQKGLVLTYVHPDGRVVSAPVGHLMKSVRIIDRDDKVLVREYEPLMENYKVNELPEGWYAFESIYPIDLVLGGLHQTLNHCQNIKAKVYSDRK